MARMPLVRELRVVPLPKVPSLEKNMDPNCFSARAHPDSREMAMETLQRTVAIPPIGILPVVELVPGR